MIAPNNTNFYVAIISLNILSISLWLIFIFNKKRADKKAKKENSRQAYITDVEKNHLIKKYYNLGLENGKFRAERKNFDTGFYQGYKTAQTVKVNNNIKKLRRCV